MTDELANVTLTNITAILTAVGALGTAAYGLVDATKAVAGGMSNPGFGYVKAMVEPLLVEKGTATSFGKNEIVGTLRANWLNGVPKADQKAIAKSLIRLGLTPENAADLARSTGVDPDRLRVAVQNARAGEPLSAQDINLLGEFDVVVSAILDRGYERADQFYRNWAKLMAAISAILLALAAGRCIGGAPEYWGSSRMGLALIVGAVSTPLAPVIKDLSSSLSAAFNAISAVKR